MSLSHNSGKIIKGIAGFYYVRTESGEIFSCKAKGIFRNRNVSPLVGDCVKIEIVDESQKIGSIVDIFSRKTELMRPQTANVDQVMVVFAAADPKPNCNLLDRFLIMMAKQEMKVLIVLNKKDLAISSELQELQEIYEGCGYPVFLCCAKSLEGIETVRSVLDRKTTVLAGPSGVGKSTLLNALCPEANMETGEISQKIKRGKHTTRHAELICLHTDTYLIDTPGFSSLYLYDLDKEELKQYFKEFLSYEEDCRFLGCLHQKEPDCAVKHALEKGKISKRRYENYQLLYEELKYRKQYGGKEG